ncbi:MAG: DinB family protein [Isosphaeraceae bacterium]
MGPKDVIRNCLDTSDFFIKSYVNDLTDDEFKLVPIEGMNPIAMQMGHLIAVEHMINELVEPGSAPALPAGFAEAHDIKKAEGTAGFRSKDEYVKLWDEQRAATKAVLDRLNDSDLADNRDGKLPPWAPTVGVALNMAGMHALNHSGQFVAVRRKLKKPITV